MGTSAPVYPAAFPIPLDLFVFKKHPGLKRGELAFADSSGTIVFKVINPSKGYKKSTYHRILLDASGKALITIRRNYVNNSRCWEGFKDGDAGEKDLIFRAHKTLNKLTRTELEVFFPKETSGESSPFFKVKGCRFLRSCSIYRGESIVAQTSLMYKLHQVFVGRSKFRVTIFPGPVDTVLFVSFIVIFLD